MLLEPDFHDVLLHPAKRQQTNLIHHTILQKVTAVIDQLELTKTKSGRREIPLKTDTQNNPNSRSTYCWFYSFLTHACSQLRAIHYCEPLLQKPPISMTTSSALEH